MESIKLKIIKSTPNAYLPIRGTALSAGFDLKSAYDCCVPKGGSTLIKTDLRIMLPAGTYGRIAPRSGLALKNKIIVGAGVIDADYRGDIGVLLFNLGTEDFLISRGDRIAQLICTYICYPEIEEVQEFDSTERGNSGYGSTGK